jgi:membrane-associated phospholipid phosphatase
MPQRPPRHFLIAAAGCAAAFVVLLASVYFSSRVRWLDAHAMQGFIDLQRPAVLNLLERVGHLADPLPVGLLGGALAAFALARGKPRHAAAVIVLLAATSVSSQVLKAIFDYPRPESLISFPWVKEAGMPSGHATAAMTIALAGVLVAPQRARALAAAAGGLFALAVGYSIVALSWHFPSDVAGGFIVATGWTLAAVAALRWAAARWPEKTGRSRARARLADVVERATEAGLVVGLAVAAVVGAIVAAAIVLTRPGQVLDYAAANTTAVIAAVALAVSAGLLLAGVSAALKRRH